MDLKFIATLTGRELTVGTQNVPARQVLYVNASNQITLAATPVSDLKIYILTGDKDVGTEQILGNPATTQNTYSISNATVTLNSTSCPYSSTLASNTKLVATYKYAAGALTKKMTFSADRFAPYLRVVGTGIVTDATEGREYPTKFEIIKAKPKNDFTITMMSTEATKLDKQNCRQ